jgi:hypothetical protein
MCQPCHVTDLVVRAAAAEVRRFLADRRIDLHGVLTAEDLMG